MIWQSIPLLAVNGTMGRIYELLQDVLRWLFASSWSAAFFAAASALGTFVLAYIALKHFSHARTSKYVERYTTCEFIQLRAEVDQFLYLSEKLSVRDRSQLYLELLFSDHLEDLAFRHKLWTFTMLFNEVGAAWEDKVFSSAVAKNFDRLIPRYWIRLRPYITNLILRFRFELPVDCDTPTCEFLLFKGFGSAYAKMCPSKPVSKLKAFFSRKKPIGIKAQDLNEDDLMKKDNFLYMEMALLPRGETSVPPGPRRLAGPSVIAQFTRDGHL